MKNSVLIYLICSASVRSISFLSFIVPTFGWNIPWVSLGFLKRSLVFPILFFSSVSSHWSLKKTFLSVLAILWSSAFKWVYFSFSSLPLVSLLCSAIFKDCSDNYFAFLYFFFLVMVLITASHTMAQTSIPSSSGTLSDLLPWKYLSLPLYNHKGFYFSSVQFSRSVMSDYLGPHELQHTRPPCIAPAPGVYPNSCPLILWCHQTISSSVIPFSSCSQSFPASGSFQMSQLFASGGQSIGVSSSTSVLPMNTQVWSALGWTGWISLQSKGCKRVFSNTIVQKHQFFCAQLSL